MRLLKTRRADVLGFLQTRQRGAEIDGQNLFVKKRFLARIATTVS
jgi:hypothetical protein